MPKWHNFPLIWVFLNKNFPISDLTESEFPISLLS
jgi:hypothetical protein